MPAIFVLNIDATGTSEYRDVPFGFSTIAEILAGDSLAFSPAPAFSQVAPVGQPSLTFGSPSISGSVVTFPVSVTAGYASAQYPCCCRATTAAGWIVEAFVTVILSGPGPAIAGSGAPPSGGYSGPIGG